ncbi:hydroxymethylglutaryl-CoA lyase [Enterovirga sp. CN4-39]|uniref:hydroxymethylglutaryl-CoA lyase n=1 Tax=Enterovirga sp. CN4-39 TaxID=3400910 RepID=UPI003C0FCA49
MSDLPGRIDIHEEGPREGFQFEKTIYPIEQRVALVDALTETGLKDIQVASFVNPKLVPQMADAAELFGRIRKKPGVRHTALWLNERGFEQAIAAPGVDLAGKLLFYASDPFSRQNNGCSREEMRHRQAGWLPRYEAAGIAVEAAYVMTAFGCNLQGEVPVSAVREEVRWVAELCREAGAPLPAIYLADTVGWATPLSIERRIGAVRELLPDARIGLHLHDTRGTAPASFYAALRMGVTLFDGSLAGLGGCPFAGHGQGAAAGNICTEDMVFMAHEMGIETGIDLERLIEAARMAERIIGRPLAGRVMHSESLPRR